MLGNSRNQDKLSDIDLGLAVMVTIIPRGIRCTHRAIADVCGCSVSLIYQIEMEAKKKVWQLMEVAQKEL